MNINFNPYIKVILPFFVIITIAYFINSIVYFYLPKTGIEYENNQNYALNYHRYDYKDAYGLIKKKEEINKPKVQEYKLIDNLTLKAIYAAQDGKGWIILSENKNSETYILANNDTFKDYVLNEVYPYYVIFKKGDNEYKLTLNTDDKNVKYEMVKKDSNNQNNQTISVIGNDVIVKRNYLNSYVNDISKIWNNISIGEIYKNGKINGFEIKSIKKGSAFEKLGLQRGDVIKAVNNIELKSYKDAFDIFNKINTIKYLNIKILRGNQEMEMNYEIN